jgi:hypothetical protein
MQLLGICKLAILAVNCHLLPDRRQHPLHVVQRQPMLLPCGVTRRHQPHRIVWHQQPLYVATAHDQTRRGHRGCWLTVAQQQTSGVRVGE